MLKKIALFMAVFLVGAAASLLYTSFASAQDPDWDMQTGGYEFSVGDYLQRNQQAPDVASPKDRIAENQILVNRERVQINVKDVEWASFTDTHSMEPVIFAGANAIEVKPDSEEDIQVGDIAAYESEYAEGTIIHRVIYKGRDEKGTYFILKGDNNPTSDPGRVRFSQIKRLVVAIIY